MKFWENLEEFSKISKTLGNRPKSPHRRLSLSCYFNSRASGSHWHGVLAWSVALLFGGISWRLGNGCTVKFWVDKWLDKVPLKDAAAADIPQELLSKSVSDYWLEGAGWNCSGFAHYLPTSILLRIATVVISSFANDSGRPCWSETDSGLFSVKSAHKLEACWNSNGSWHGWKKLWKFNLQERVRLFLWRVSHGALLTN